jgi:ribosomal protein S18 acetylase RimI-like enzyme
VARWSRAYQPDSDLATLIGFLPRVRSPLCLADYPSAIDLREILALPANQGRARLWFDAQGGLAGYGIVDHFDNLLFDVLPDGKVAETCREILEWAEESARIGRTSSGPISLDVTCREEDAQRRKHLMEKGYDPSGLSTVTLVRSLAEAIPQPALPPGWTIRPVGGEGEVTALVALHRAAFGTDRLTVEERLSWMRAPHYLPALDLVLETAAGDLAGYCMCGIERESNEITGQRRGYTDPVAVHPEHRGWGGARALLSHGMVLLVQHEMTEAIMNTSSDNVRLLRLAFSLGYRVESTRVRYSRALA